MLHQIRDLTIIVRNRKLKRKRAVAKTSTRWTSLIVKLVLNDRTKELSAE